MKALWRFLCKGFLSILGLSLGVVAAFGFILTLVVAGPGAQDVNFVAIPDAEGEVKELGKEAPIIAVVGMKDVIMSSKHSAKTMQSALSALDNDSYKSRIKGLIIDMDCPGGEVFEIERVYSALQFWKQRTGCPVYVFVNGLCASGGYYVACAADKIYCTPSSLIGSVGVVSGPYFNVKEGLSRCGVQTDVLTAGKDKAPMNPFTPWTEEEKAIRQEIMTAIYDQFVDVVVENRSAMTKDKLVNKLGARVFPAKKALAEGFVDVVNASKQQVIQELAVACQIETNYRVIGIDSDGWLKRVRMMAENSPLITGTIKHEVLSSHADQSLSMWYY